MLTWIKGFMIVLLKNVIFIARSMHIDVMVCLKFAYEVCDVMSEKKINLNNFWYKLLSI